MSCYCNDSSPSMYVETWHKARKEHKCCECKRKIKPGDEYERIAGVWDGDFSTYKTCEVCAGLRDALAEFSCPTFGGLGEEYFNYLDGFLKCEEYQTQYDQVFVNCDS